MADVRVIAVRLAAVQCTLYIAMAIQLVFWPLYLSSKGMSAVAVGQILAVSYLAILASNPLAGYLTDRSGKHRLVLCVLAGATFFSALLFGPTKSFWSLCLITFVSAGAYTAMLPMIDNLTVLSASQHSFAYGRVRLWGSISFIATTYCGGLFLVQAPASFIWMTLIAVLAINWSVTLALPGTPRRSTTSESPRESARLLLSGQFILFVAAAGFCQASHVLYYGFGTLHWKAAGLSGSAIGFLWSEGVVAEVVLFAIGDRMMGRIPPLAWIAVGGAAGVFRWSVLAFTTNFWPLVAAQSLHGFTYAAVQLGAMHHIQRSLPAGLSARAQGVYCAVVGGVAQAIMMLSAGSLYTALAGRAYLVMSAASGLGLVLTILLMSKNRNEHAAEYRNAA